MSEVTSEVMNEKLHLTCPHCGAVNRIPEARLHDAPKCGKCKKVILLSEPVVLTDDNFNAFIENNDIPVIVDFWADWCGPCKMMAPIFSQAAGELSPNVILAKANTDDAHMASLRYSVRSIPTLIKFKNGKEVERQTGAMPLQALKQWASS